MTKLGWTRKKARTHPYVLLGDSAYFRTVKLFETQQFVRCASKCYWTRVKEGADTWCDRRSTAIDRLLCANNSASSSSVSNRRDTQILLLRPEVRHVLWIIYLSKDRLISSCTLPCVVS